MVLTLPRRLPDENLCSLSARIAHLSGMDGLTAIGLLMGEAKPTSVVGCAANIKHFCEVTKGVYGSPRDILRNLTVLPLRVHLGELDTAVLSQVEAGTIAPPLVTLDFGASRRCRWKACAQCMSRDLKEHGVAYWHRSHQLATTLYCPEHRVRLITFDVRRKRLHEQFILPYQFSGDLSANVDVAACDHANSNLEMSMLGHEALLDAGEPQRQLAIRDTYKSVLIDMDYLTHTGKMSTKKHFKQFVQELGRDAAVAELLRHSSISSSRRLLAGIVDERSGRPFSRLMLVSWLFGSWDAFKQACLWRDALDISHEVAHRTDAVSQFPLHFAREQESSREHREACCRYKSSTDTPTRHEFMRRAQRSWRWLFHYDREWLDEELPLVKRVKAQPDLFS